MPRIQYSLLIQPPVKETPNKSGRKRRWFARERISLAEMSAMFRQLSDLMSAGLSLMAALRMAADQSAHPALKSVLQTLARDVRGGESLSRAMERHRFHFSDFQIRLVYSGESSGSLDQSLERLADLAEKEDEIRSQVQAALAYPLFIVAVGIGTLFFLLAFVVPRMAAMFADFQQALPLPTRILLGISGGMSRYGWLGLPSIAALIAASRRPAIRFKLKARWDAWALRLPVMKSWILKRELASYMRTLGSLLKNGVPILQALPVAMGTARNGAFREALAPIAAKIREGASFSRCLRDIPLIPATLCNLAAVGEEGGKLAETLLKVAESCERQSQRELKTAVSLLEPMLILVIGAALGAIVISIMLPVFEINALIR